MGGLDIAVFVGFIAAVVAVGLWKSRSAREADADSQDYFLAGRGLTWWLIGFSLIAANISTEQFVGMSGNAASHVGLAIASYEWMAAVTLVVVAFCFLPYFLRAGIYTMPEFLEYRFNWAARLVMALATVLIYLLLLAAVTYSGALTVRTLGTRFGMDIQLWQPSVFIVVVALIYVVTGGLKASVWADLLQGSALIIGGAIVMFLAFQKLGEVNEAAAVVDVATGEIAVRQLDADQNAYERFMELNANRMNMFLPSNDHVVPWTALLLGLWIPNFYYWGLNQYITQRTLGSSSLAEGQKGIVFAAYLKLLIPFVVVVPGIIAFNLFHDDMRREAQGDVADAMSLYAKANPDSEFVSVLNAPDNATLEAHQGPGYVIALYGDVAALANVATTNPLVLPMTQARFDARQPAQFQVFSSAEDHAWKHVHPELAAEVAAFNASVEQAAASAGATVQKQALVAYKYDTALGHLLGMLPQNTGLFGFVIAALLGAVISSLAAMLNAATSIFTMDLVKQFVTPNASESALVLIGRVGVIVFAAVACLLAPALGDPNISNSIFTIIQESQGLISPGILAVFIVGLVLRRCPRWAGVLGLFTSIVGYAGLRVAAPQIQFLNRMAIVFGICIALMVAMTIVAPLREPVVFEAKTNLDLRSSRGALIAGLVGIVLTLSLYVLFSPWGIAG